MDEARYFEEKAAQCRRLAATVNDKQMIEQLLKLALEYDAKTAAVRRTAQAREDADPSGADDG